MEMVAPTATIPNPTTHANFTVIESGVEQPAWLLAAVTNDDFLTAIFGDEFSAAYPVVCRIEGDPTDSEIWPPQRWPCDTSGTGLNWYTAPATFRRHPRGDFRAKKQQADMVYCVMLDDAGSRFPLERLATCPPSWMIETSPGNFQVGYIFDQPVSASSEVADRLNKALIAAGVCDAGATGGATRWIRLPVAVNGKAKYGYPSPRCRLAQWNPERRYSIGQMVDRLGLTLPVDDRPRVDTTQAQQTGGPVDWDQVRSALDHLGADFDYPEWVNVLMALQSTGHPEAYPLAVEWSARGAKFKGEWDVRKHWDSFNAGKAGGITIATLFKMALDAGWMPPAPDVSGMFKPVGETPWPAPLPLPKLPPVPTFDLALLPEAIRPWIADVAERLQVPPDMPAVAAVVALSATIGLGVQIRPKALDPWTVVPNLWGMVVAPPGWKKSPAIAEAMAPLHKLERDANHEHSTAMAAWQMEVDQTALMNSAIKSKGLQALKKDPEAKAPDLIPEPVEPVAKRYVVNNFTLEALGEVMISNPNGVLAFADELYGLLKMADKPGNEELHSFLLTAWNGNGGFTFDRIGRGQRFVEFCCIAVLGGIQPGRLDEYLTSGGAGGAVDSGFLNRFQLMTWPDLDADYRYTDRTPNYTAKAAYQGVFDRLAGATLFPDLSGTTSASSGQDVRQFDGEAQAVYREWLEALERLCRSDTLPPVMTSHLSKYASLVPSLALIFAVADHVGGAIPVQYLHQAIAWAAYLRGHAERVFASSTNPGATHARALLAKIRTGAIADGFSARDVYRNQWSLLDREGVEAAVEMLCDLDHLRRVEIVPAAGGRPSAVFNINPKSKA